MSQTHDSFTSWSLQGGTIYQADCVDLIPTLESESINLIYIDPPFGTGSTRVRRGEDPASYNDKWGSTETYLDWLMKRIALMREVLRPDGSLLVHLDYHAVFEVKIAMDTLFGRKNFRRDIIWHFQTGGPAPKNSFSCKHHTILWYTKGESWYFDPEPIKIPRTEKSKHRSQCEKNRRIHPDNNLKNPHDVVEVPEDQDAQLEDFSTVPALNPMSIERTGYPDEKPIALMEFFIKGLSQEKDLIADFFVGSGTTAAAAARLGRSWIACDQSSRAIEATHEKFEKRVGPGGGPPLPGQRNGRERRDHRGNRRQTQQNEGF